MLNRPMGDEKQRRRPRIWILALMALVAFLALLTRTGDGRGTRPAAPALEPVDPSSVDDPVRAGAPLPDGYRPLLRRDDIAPVYSPELVGPEEIDWAPATLVVGVAVDAEAHAYPVNFMNVHEMVNDRIGGIPVLVSW